MKSRTILSSRSSSFILFLRIFSFSLFLCPLCVTNGTAQSRNSDTIFTVKKDTLVVKILEIRIYEVKYKEFGNDSSLTHSIHKSDISKVVYGNGESELFPELQNYPVEAIGQKFYKLALPSAFQKEITQWPEEKLLMEKLKYQDRASITTTLGVATAIATPILFVAGFVTIFQDIFSDSNKAPKLLIAAAITGTATAPLMIFSSKNRKKYKSIKMELGRRAYQNP